MLKEQRGGLLIAKLKTQLCDAKQSEQASMYTNFFLMGCEMADCVYVAELIIIGFLVRSRHLQLVIVLVAAVLCDVVAY